MSDRKERFTAGKFHAVGLKVLDEDDFTVAKCGWISQGDEEAEANAFLFAAAPDMYSLLKEMLSSEYAQGTQFMAYYERAITNLLKKARGEEWNG